MQGRALACVLKLQEYLTGYGESGVLVVRTGMNGTISGNLGQITRSHSPLHR